MDMKLIHNKLTMSDRTVTHNGQLFLSSQQRDEIYSNAGFPTMPEMPAIRPDEFYADQHVIGPIRLLSSW